MNNEFKYGIQGLLMAVAFFVALKFSFFIIDITEPKKEEKSIFSADNSDPVITINENGKILFDDNCAPCHKLHYSEPDLLRNIDEKIPDCVKLRKFIRNSKDVIQSGDSYFTDLYNKFNKIDMGSFPELSDKDIDDILEYIDQSY